MDELQEITFGNSTRLAFAGVVVTIWMRNDDGSNSSNSSSSSNNSDLRPSAECIATPIKQNEDVRNTTELTSFSRALEGEGRGKRDGCKCGNQKSIFTFQWDDQEGTTFIDIRQSRPAVTSYRRCCFGPELQS